VFGMGTGVAPAV